MSNSDMNRFIIAKVSFVLVLMLAEAGQAVDARSDPTAGNKADASIAAQVKEFYRGYINQCNAGKSADDFLKARRSFLTPALLDAVRKNEKICASNPNEIAE